MSRGRVISIIYFLTTVISIFIFYNTNQVYEVETTRDFVVEYSPNMMGVAVYRPLSTNTMKCNFTTVNTIIENMIVEGFYSIHKDYSEGNLLDIILTNGNEEHRILYNRRTRDFMSLSNPFLKNYIPGTYIHE